MKDGRIGLSNPFEFGDYDGVYCRTKSQSVDCCVLHRSGSICYYPEPFPAPSQFGERVCDARSYPTTTWILRPEGRHKSFNYCAVESELCPNRRIDIALVAKAVSVQFCDAGHELRRSTAADNVGERPDLTTQNLRDGGVAVKESAVEIEENSFNHAGV